MKACSYISKVKMLIIHKYQFLH